MQEAGQTVKTEHRRSAVHIGSCEAEQEGRKVRERGGDFDYSTILPSLRGMSYRTGRLPNEKR